jgi:hypothetical protein
MTHFDYAVRLLSAIPFDQRVMLLYGATCWSDEQFNDATEEQGCVAVKLLRELSPAERAAAFYEASPPPSWLKPKPALRLVDTEEPRQ